MCNTAEGRGSWGIYTPIAIIHCKRCGVGVVIPLYISVSSEWGRVALPNFSKEIQLWVAGRWPRCSWNVKYAKSLLPTRSRRSIYVLHKTPLHCHFFISRKRCHISPHQIFVWQETPNSETLPARGTHFLSSKWLQTHLHWQVTTYILLWCFCSFENVNKNLMWKKNNFFQICVPMSLRQLILSYKIK